MLFTCYFSRRDTSKHNCISSIKSVFLRPSDFAGVSTKCGIQLHRNALSKPPLLWHFFIRISQQISCHPHIPHSSSSWKRGTSLSFNSTVYQHSVHYMHDCQAVHHDAGLTSQTLVCKLRNLGSATERVYQHHAWDVDELRWRLNDSWSSIQ